MEKSNLKIEETEDKIIDEQKDIGEIFENLEKSEKIQEVETEQKTIKEKNEERKEEVKEKRQEKNIKSSNKKTIIRLAIVGIILLLAIIVFSTIFAIININNNNIVSGVKIKGIDVSGLSRDEAKSKIEMIYNDKKERDILLKYEDYDTTINSELLEVDYKIEKAIDEAISIGKDGNIFINNYNILFALTGKKDINVDMTMNEEIAKQTIEDIGTNIPGAVTEPDYYIENDKLIITKGKEGKKINAEELLEKIKNNLDDVTSNENYIEIPVVNKVPEEIDIDKIHEEIYKEVQDAYYTKDPFTIYPEVEGVDFNVDEAKKILEEDKEQYEIQLTITKPKVTTSQIGSEAFPDLLATYSTNYDGGNIDRTTNLKIACQKINDKVVLPDEIFSYNKALGERTAAAGYKNAKVYENGQVVDGIGGGICQISSTLYNSVLMANMEATERRNHMFVTSYTPAGRDATVVYGITDFKFKNTRKSAIKIKASCSNGVATVSIYGIKEENEYKVSFNTKTISTIPFTVKYVDDNTLTAGTEKVRQKGANGLITETYIVKSLNGKVVSSKLLSKDTYSAMQKIVLKGTKGATTKTNNNTNNTNNNSSNNNSNNGNSNNGTNNNGTTNNNNNKQNDNDNKEQNNNQQDKNQQDGNQQDKDKQQENKKTETTGNTSQL